MANNLCGLERHPLLWFHFLEKVDADVMNAPRAGFDALGQQQYRAMYQSHKL